MIRGPHHAPYRRWPWSLWFKDAEKEIAQKMHTWGLWNNNFGVETVLTVMRCNTSSALFFGLESRKRGNALNILKNIGEHQLKKISEK